MPTNTNDISEETKRIVLKEYRKKIYEKNKENIIKINKEYIKVNKEKLNKKIICICGVSYLKKNKSIHIKTNLHKIYLKGLNDGRKEKQKSLSDSSNSDDSSSYSSDDSSSSSSDDSSSNED